MTELNQRQAERDVSDFSQWRANDYFCCYFQEKLEAFEKSEKSGKELHKEQKDALAKLPEVLGQMECIKELSEQIKKIQTEVGIRS